MHLLGSSMIMDDSALEGLGSIDPQAQHRAIEYLNKLQSTSNGWEVCANALTSGKNNNDHVKFFCFQVIEYYLKTYYPKTGPEDQQKMKNFLMCWLSMHCQNPSNDERYVRNKAAMAFACAFITDFPARWPTFFSDLLEAASTQGTPAVWIYLRVLMAIDTEVVDRDIPHTEPEYLRNTALKDAMRDNCVPQMVDSWYEIIKSYQSSEPELTCFCLGVIGAYVAWIDIGLIANARFVQLLLGFMSMPLLREAATDCIHEVLLKGMDPVAKTELIENFCSVLQANGIFNVGEDEESDYLAKLSKLINGMGQQLILCWQRLSKSKAAGGAAVSLAAMESKVPLMLRFLAHEDDDVSGCVVQFAHDYITTLKQLGPLTDARKATLRELLFVVMEKMKYDKSYDFDKAGEDEGMFDEYRKELKVLINNLGQLDSGLLLATVQELGTQTFERWQQVTFADAELAVTLVYQLGEALPSSHGQHFSGDPNKASAVQQLLRLMITSKLSCFRHEAVQLQFFETVVRYDKFFSIEPEHVAEVLTAFLDERGLRNDSPHVRSRTAYLFSRFIKAINKQHVQPYLEDMLGRVHDLLILHSPDNGICAKIYLSDDDQFFMYETAGILIIHSQFEAEKKQVLMKQLLAPIVSKFQGLLDSMLAEQDEERQQLYAKCLVQAMHCASRTSKGFTATQTMAACGCVDAYTEVLELFIRALAAPSTAPGTPSSLAAAHATLQPAVRQFLHRMVVCLDQRILPFLPAALTHLLHRPDARQLHDFIPLINQLICKFKKAIVPFLQQVFVSLVQTIFSVLNATRDERDQVALTEHRMLQRSYFSFIQTLLNNGLPEVLNSQDASTLQPVLTTVIQGAVEIPDPQGQKICYVILRKLVEHWATKENELAGFVDYVYEQIVPACFLGPLKQTFDLTDAQTILALNECAMCLKLIAEKRGDECLGFLQNTYLPTLHVSPELCQEFCQALQADHKLFKSYFKSFFLRAKS